MNIQPVSPEVASGKLVKVVMTIYSTINPIIYPAAILGYSAAFIFIILGAVIHSKTIKKVGITDFGVITLVLISYFLMPTFVGVLKTIETIVK
ncbi:MULTISPECIES: hypothetical protein [Clostridium]|uniref:hypothetical protein n=1 Tax=Clostridium TaxID=1485 RepID=UPI000824E0EF|nr:MULTISPECIES: hypothetical protein [Clostridium]PJI10012.1 hypothetical protein CUB90_20000 [Clostridium sp. CT7]